MKTEINVGDYVLHDDVNENTFDVGVVSKIYAGGEFDMEFCEGGSVSPAGEIKNCIKINKMLAMGIHKLIENQTKIDSEQVISEDE